MLVIISGQQPSQPSGLEDWCEGSQSLWFLCRQCWELDSTKRPNMPEIVARLRSLVQSLPVQVLTEAECTERAVTSSSNYPFLSTSSPSTTPIEFDRDSTRRGETSISPQNPSARDLGDRCSSADSDYSNATILQNTAFHIHIRDDAVACSKDVEAAREREACLDNRDHRQCDTGSSGDVGGANNSSNGYESGICLGMTSDSNLSPMKPLPITRRFLELPAVHNLPTLSHRKRTSNSSLSDQSGYTSDISSLHLSRVASFSSMRYDKPLPIPPTEDGSSVNPPAIQSFTVALQKPGTFYSPTGSDLEGASSPTRLDAELKRRCIYIQVPKRTKDVFYRNISRRSGSAWNGS